MSERSERTIDIVSERTIDIVSERTIGTVVAQGCVVSTDLKIHTARRTTHR